MTDKLITFVAMSGGVDSSVAAALLLEQGHHVEGIMMRLWAGGQTAKDKIQADIDRAKKIATALRIPFHLIDASEVFYKDIVNYYLEIHASGRTPNPCFVCNQQIKWGYLLHQAISLGADSLASGHYASIDKTRSGIYRIKKAVDTKKDQSYVLAGLSQEQLSRMLLPLGELTKKQVKIIAHRYGIEEKEQEESQDLCFLAKDPQDVFFDQYRPELNKPGDIRTMEGGIVGVHHGLANYTIGQRKGVSKGGGVPLYVIAKDVLSNALIVGRSEQLGRKKISIENVTWTSGVIPDLPVNYDVKIRYKSELLSGTISSTDDTRYVIIFDDIVRDATPGQYAVFYDGEYVVGSGIISRSIGLEE